MTGELSPGLYLVATPIGTARDITLRGLDVLAAADVLAAEDTRSARHLMDIHGVALNGRRIIAYHDQNGPAARPAIMAALAAGKSVAYTSEAGTPLIADPGYQLVNEARAAGHSVIAVPGASAVITAMMVAGLPSDRFLFAGFLPSSGGARRKVLQDFAATPATLIFFESPKRLFKTLTDMVALYGPDRRVAICRELTKKFEEVSLAPVGELVENLEGRTVKGEIVLLVDRPGDTATGEGMDEALNEALKTMRTRDAADHVASKLGLPRRQVYQAALALAEKARG